MSSIPPLASADRHRTLLLKFMERSMLTEVGLDIGECHDRAISSSTAAAAMSLRSEEVGTVLLPKQALCEESRRETNSVVESELIACVQ